MGWTDQWSCFEIGSDTQIAAPLEAEVLEWKHRHTVEIDDINDMVSAVSDAFAIS